MALQIIVGCDFDWPAARMVDDVHDLFLVGVEMDDAKWDHPTTQAHNPIWPWACWFGGERNDERLGAITIDHHRDCRGCVLAMGVSAMNPPWRDNPGVDRMRDWYEHHRHAHQLPPLPEGR